MTSSRVHGRRVSPRVRRRRAVVAMLAMLVVVAVVFVATNDPQSASKATNSSTTTSPVSSSTTTPTTVSVTSSTQAGNLPPTVTEPPTTTDALTVRLSPLFSALANGSGGVDGLFFPRSVYIRMKTGILANPAGDFNSRLLAFFHMDEVAYHHVMPAPASTAQLLTVRANALYATWITPGACENRFGYWHLPGVRLVYRDHGVRSFAVASLISWRGEWYVVHLGPNPRPVDIGTVASPALGAGTPGPPGGC